MRRQWIGRTLAVLFVAATASAMPLYAGGSFDFLFSMSKVGDDTQMFLNLAVGDAGFPRPAIEPILPRLRVVETDLPVVLFLGRHSGRSLDFIVSLRSRGYTWSAIFARCDVPYDVLFVGINRDPGPPYGKAWGYWKKRNGPVRLADEDIVGLVQVQTGHRLSGRPTWEIANERGKGRPVAYVVADSKGRPWKGEKGKGNNQGGGNDHPGRGRGVGKGLR